MSSSSAGPFASKKYGELTLLERIGFIATLVKLCMSPTTKIPDTMDVDERNAKAFILLSDLITNLFSKRTLRNQMGFHVLRVMGTGASIAQYQSIMPPPPEISVYESYMKSEKLESKMEETGEGGHVFWFGKKDARNVLFYIHGGGFVLPLGNFYPSFLGYLYKQLDIRGVDFSIAMLSYSVYPDAPFPLVLKQTISALNSLINAGLSPQRIHLCGDSSGGNVILQLLSHILHPLEDVPSIALQNQPFGSIILMSPWVSMTADSPSHFRETGRDFLGRKVLKEWGAVTLDYIASLGDAGKHLTPYLEGAKAPDDWYSGVQALAPYVLITAGEYELLLDDIESFLKTFRTRHGEVTYFLEEGAMHVSPLADGFFNETNRTTPTTQKIIDWLEARCKATEQTK